MTSLTLPAPGIHEAVYKPRRLVTPAELAARAKLELIHQPLYSTVALAGGAVIPPSSTLFTYAVGATVPGAGGGAVASTLFHTNMEVAGFLAAPKIQIVHGISVVLNLLGAASPPVLPDASASTPVTNVDFVEDLQALNYVASLIFRVGPKVYVRHSMPFMPANTGLAGAGDVSTQQQAVAAPVKQAFDAMYSCGAPFTWPIYPVLIASQQSFSCELQNQTTATPTLFDDHWVTVYLEGIHGREVS